MIFDKTLLAAFVLAHLALLAFAEPTAQQFTRAELGRRRKLLVVRRKKLEGSDDEGDGSRRSKSLAGPNFRHFGQGQRQGAVSTFAGLHNRQEPYRVDPPAFPARQPFPTREPFSSRQRLQQTKAHNNQPPPAVPGLGQHRLALEAHEAQIQAHLALAHGHKVNKGHHQGASHLNHIVLQSQQKPLVAPKVIQPIAKPQPIRLDHQVNQHVQHHVEPQLTQHIVEPQLNFHVVEPQFNPQVESHFNHQAEPQLNLHLNHQAEPQLNLHLNHQAEPQLNLHLNHQPEHQLNLHLNHHADPHLNHQVAAQVLPAPVIQLQPIDFRQGSSGPIDLEAVAIAGERCIDKIVNVEETEYEESIDCHHSYNQKCHTTYTTDFAPQQEEECEENFKKDCFIEYNKVAHNETVEFCHTPLVKDCNIQGPVECRTEYESECETLYHEHVLEEDVPECETIKEYKCETVQSGYSSEEKCQEWPKERCSIRKELVRKVTPETGCKKVPKEKCAPAGCGFVQGVPECFDKTETIVQEVPEEQCNLEPSKSCKHVTKLVPKLQPIEECVDVPKEVCVRSNGNPKTVTKPVLKKWCYTPSPESGLF